VALSHYCLDTSAYSQFMRGDPTATELIDSADRILLPSIVIGELWVGFLQGNRILENQRDLQRFLANPVVEEVVPDATTGKVYAEVVVALRRAGTPLPTNDIWIAALAASSGATVLTFDAHFERIQRVGSLILPPPEKI